MAVGSIMRLCNSNTIIWGSGIRDIDQNIKKGIIRSVRGPLTRNRLIQIKCECPPIYGDPGLFLSKIYYHKNIKKKYKLGLTPHSSQYNNVYNMYKNENNVLVIDLRTKNIEKVINNILSCERIASSSVHGIVVSNAYNIPVKWIKFDKLYGDDTKFYDHFKSIGVNVEKNIYIDAVTYKKISVDKIIKSIVPYKIKIDMDRLLDASFFNFEKKEIRKSVRYQISKNLS